MASPTDTVVTTIDLPRELHKRALALVAKRNPYSNLRQLVRAAIKEKIEAIEEADRRASAERAASRAAATKAKGDRFSIPLREPVVGGSLQPLEGLRSRIDPLVAAPVGRRSRLVPIYERYAREILEAGTDKEEIKRLLLAATLAVRREMPLRYPKDEVVVGEIEEAIRTINAGGSRSLPSALAERTYDERVGSILDALTIPTRGDTARRPEATQPSASPDEIDEVDLDDEDER